VKENAPRSNLYFQTANRILATPRARGLLEFLAPLERRGRRECRMLDAPAASHANNKTSIRVSSPQVHRNQTGIPCAMVLTVTPWSPRCAGLVSHRRLRDYSHKLDTSVGVPGPHGLAVREQHRLSGRSCRVHRILPQRCDMANAPLLGQDGQIFRSDLPDGGSKIFFQKGLDKSTKLISVFQKVI